MVNEGPLSVRLLDLVLAGVLAHSEDLVVVFPLGFLQLEFGVRQKASIFGIGSERNS